MSKRANETVDEYHARKHAEYVSRKASGYDKRWRLKHRERLNAEHRAKRQADPAHHREIARVNGRRWKAKNPERARAIQSASYQRNKAKYFETAKIKNRLVRTEMLNAYGGACVCCGETAPEFLTIDHINGLDASERRPNGSRRYGAGTALTTRLKKLGWPKDNYQLLCYNCNCTKGFLGECPHERERRNRLKIVA